jgi:diguanylate cyclase (GGDEF)-like protein
MRITGWNRWMHDHAGIDKLDALGKPLTELFDPERYDFLHRAVLRAVRHGNTSILTTQPPRLALPLGGAEKLADDEPSVHSVFITPVEAHDWATLGIHDHHALLQFTDITPAHRRESALRTQSSKLAKATEELAEREQHLRTIFDRAHSGLILTTASGQIADINPAAMRLFGLDAVELHALPRVPDLIEWFDASAQIFVPFDPGVPLATRTDTQASGPGHDERSWRGVNRNARRFAIDVAWDRALSESEPMLVISIHDISEQQRNENRIRRLAHYDPLTSLPNRTLFHDRLEHAMSVCERSGEPVALHFIDLDRFKSVNDTLGHDVGDQLLQSVADRIVELTRKSDTVARLGGDEFAIVQTAIKSSANAAVLARKVIDGLQQPFSLQGHTLHTGASIGIALYPNDAEDLTTLLKQADLAMYEAKHERRGSFRFFSADMHAESQRKLALELELRHAIANDELFLQFQPVFDSHSGQVVALEALVRWRHPVRGMLKPEEFIPIAEDTGIIVALGEWVLRETCVQIGKWDASGYARKKVAINLSPTQFIDRGLVDLVDDVTGSHGISPARLEFEITESVLMSEPQRAQDALARLRKRGIDIAIDDFGTGYSSLAYLRDFPVSKLKLDATFLKDLQSDRRSASIVGTIIELGHSLGHAVVAEGVETQSQLDFLQHRQCDQVQGFHLAHPLDAPDMAGLLDESVGAEAALRTA